MTTYREKYNYLLKEAEDSINEAKKVNEDGGLLQSAMAVNRATKYLDEAGAILARVGMLSLELVIKRKENNDQ